MKKKIRLEDFHSVDAYLDPIIYEARREYREKMRKKNNQSSASLTSAWLLSGIRCLIVCVLWFLLCSISRIIKYIRI